MFRILPVLLAATLSGGCAHTRIGQLSADLEARDRQIRELEASNAGYRVDIDALERELTGLLIQNRELASFYEGMLKEFEPELRDGDAALVVYPDRSALLLGDTIAFATGSAELTIEGRAAVARLAILLKEHPERRFQVEGHTDPTPIATARYPSNWELGASRAVRVVKELVALGVPASQLSAATFAETQPFATNAHANGMAVNRRITVALQTTVEETGAQRKLYEAARETGNAWFASVPVPNFAIRE